MFDFDAGVKPQCRLILQRKACEGDGSERNAIYFHFQEYVDGKKEWERRSKDIVRSTDSWMERGGSLTDWGLTPNREQILEVVRGNQVRLKKMFLNARFERVYERKPDYRWNTWKIRQSGGITPSRLSAFK